MVDMYLLIILINRIAIFKDSFLKFGFKLIKKHIKNFNSETFHNGVQINIGVIE